MGFRLGSSRMPGWLVRSYRWLLDFITLRDDDPTDRFDSFSDVELEDLYNIITDYDYPLEAGYVVRFREGLAEEIEEEASRRGINPIKDWS